MSLMAKLEKEENDFKEEETTNQSKSWENDLGASKILNEKEENKGVNCNQLTDEQEVAGKGVTMDAEEETVKTEEAFNEEARIDKEQMKDNDEKNNKVLTKEDANDQEDTTDKTEKEEKKELEKVSENTVKTDQEENMEDRDQPVGKVGSGQEFVRRKPKVELIERRGNFQGPLCVIKPAKRKSSSNAKKRVPPEKPIQVKDVDNDYWDCPECTYKNKAEVNIS